MGPRLTACLLLLLLMAAMSPQAAALPKYELHPRLRVEEEYNDNVFLRSANQFSDFVTTFYPGFIFAARNPSGGVELEYELGYSYYYDAGSDFTRHFGAFRAYQAVTPRLSLEAIDTFYRYEELIEPGLGTLAPRPALLPYLRNTAIPRLIYRYAAESDITLTYTNIILENDDPALQDGFGNRVGVELHHALSRHNRLELGYSFERGEFEFVPTTTFLVIPDFNAHRAKVAYTYEMTRHFHLLGVYDFEDLTFLGEAVSDYRTHEGRAGFLYLFPRGWSATVTAGYFRVDFERDDDLGGLAADVLVQKVLKRGVGSVGFRRGLGEDFYSGENLGVYRYWLVGVGFTYFLKRHLGATLEAGVGTRHFPLVDRDDDFWSVETGLIYQLRKWLEAGVRYERYVLESKPGPFDFAQNRYIATIGATY